MVNILNHIIILKSKWSATAAPFHHIRNGKKESEFDFGSKNPASRKVKNDKDHDTDTNAPRFHQKPIAEETEKENKHQHIAYDQSDEKRIYIYVHNRNAGTVSRRIFEFEY